MLIQVYLSYDAPPVAFAGDVLLTEIPPFFPYKTGSEGRRALRISEMPPSWQGNALREVGERMTIVRKGQYEQYSFRCTGCGCKVVRLSNSLTFDVYDKNEELLGHIPYAREDEPITAFLTLRDHIERRLEKKSCPVCDKWKDVDEDGSIAGPEGWGNAKIVEIQHSVYCHPDVEDSLHNEIFYGSLIFDFKMVKEERQGENMVHTLKGRQGNLKAFQKRFALEGWE